jgi:hypothetical protein
LRCVIHASSSCTSWPVTEAPNPCSGHILAPIPQFGSSSPTSRCVSTCCGTESGLMLLQIGEKLVSWSTFHKEVQNRESWQFGFCSWCVTHAVSFRSLYLKRPTLVQVTSSRLFRQSGGTLPPHQLPVLFRYAIAWRAVSCFGD